MGVIFELTNKEEFLKLAKDLEGKIAEVDKVIKEIDGFEFKFKFKGYGEEGKIMDKNKKAPNSFELDAEVDDLFREKVNKVLKENNTVKIDIDTMVSIFGTTNDGIVQSTKVNKSKK